MNECFCASSNQKKIEMNVRPLLTTCGIMLILFWTKLTTDNGAGLDIFPDSCIKVFV